MGYTVAATADTVPKSLLSFYFFIIITDKRAGAPALACPSFVPSIPCRRGVRIIDTILIAWRYLPSDSLTDGLKSKKNPTKRETGLPLYGNERKIGFVYRVSHGPLKG